jgi:hypothetical protein
MIRNALLGISLMLVGTAAAAQGSSPVQVTGITVSPTTFKGGDQVTITVSLANTSSKPYGCVGTPYNAVSVYIFKAEAHITTNLVWQNTQVLPGVLAAGERKTVTLSTRWPVPASDVAEWQIVAWSPICAPDEFGQQAVLKIGKECMYRYTPRIQFTPRVPIRNLRLLGK